MEVKYMGYIYKIVNDINDKIYIGKTCDTIEERMKEHQRDYLKTGVEKRPLYNAMRKYGANHFQIEQIEECDNSVLNQREQYWIQFYDSYKNGYNATLGGDGTIIYDHNLIISLLKQQIPVEEISAQIGCCKLTIWKIAKNNNINLIECRNNNRKKEIAQYDLENNFIQFFPSTTEAAEWCIKNKLSTGSIIGIKSTICKNINHPDIRPTAYGYVWKYVN